MVVGVCRIELSLPGNSSLKGKRAVVRRVVDRTAHRFNVAVAEVDRMDGLQQATLGVAVVSNETKHANSMLDHIVSFVEGASEALVVGRQMELWGFGEEHDVAGSWDEFASDDDEAS